MTKKTTDRILSNKIVELFDGHEMVDIGTALVLVAGTYIAKSELEYENGNEVMKILLKAFEEKAKICIDRIQKVKTGSPEELQEFIDRVSQPLH